MNIDVNSPCSWLSLSCTFYFSHLPNHCAENVNNGNWLLEEEKIRSYLCLHQRVCYLSLSLIFPVSYTTARRPRTVKKANYWLLMSFFLIIVVQGRNPWAQNREEARDGRELLMLRRESVLLWSWAVSDLCLRFGRVDVTGSKSGRSFRQRLRLRVFWAVGHFIAVIMKVHVGVARSTRLHICKISWTVTDIG